MDAILIFVRLPSCLHQYSVTDCALQAGLFSASVTGFIIESYKKLSQDPDDVTVMLLARISQQLAGASNGTDLNSPESFQPTLSTLRVNAFWFLSLAFSLICALAATLVQQWARNYLQIIDRRPSPHKKGEHSQRDICYMNTEICDFHFSPDPFFFVRRDRDVWHDNGG
jgi:hypothetical protein